MTMCALPRLPFQLSAEYQSVFGRVLAPCEVCSAQVALSNLQRLMDCCTKVSCMTGRLVTAALCPVGDVCLFAVLCVVYCFKSLQHCMYVLDCCTYFVLYHRLWQWTH